MIFEWHSWKKRVYLEIALGNCYWTSWYYLSLIDNIRARVLWGKEFSLCVTLIFLYLYCGESRCAILVFPKLNSIQSSLKFFYGFSYQVAKTLKKNESLKACIRCNSPAKYDCYLQRAVCKREGCGFDYCTRCLCNYHTTEDCLNGKPLKANYKMCPLPGTVKSKKNLRRLWYLINICYSRSWRLVRKVRF